MVHRSKHKTRVKDRKKNKIMTKIQTVPSGKLRENKPRAKKVRRRRDSRSGTPTVPEREMRAARAHQAAGSSADDDEVIVVRMVADGGGHFARRRCRPCADLSGDLARASGRARRSLLRRTPAYEPSEPPKRAFEVALHGVVGGDGHGEAQRRADPVGGVGCRRGSCRDATRINAERFPRGME